MKKVEDVKCNKSSNASVVQFPKVQAVSESTVASEQQNYPHEGGVIINNIGTKALQVLEVAHPIVTLLAANNKKFAPVQDVLEATKEALGRHFNTTNTLPQQREAAEVIVNEVSKIRPGMNQVTVDEIVAAIKKAIAKLIPAKQPHPQEKITEEQ